MAELWKNADVDRRVELIRGCWETLRFTPVLAVSEWEQVPRYMRDVLAERLLETQHERLLMDVMAATDGGYDYHNQAWVVDGKYVACGHGTPCDCFGTRHAGEPIKANADIH